MRKPLLPFFLLPIILFAQTKESNETEVLKYFRSQPIFVTQLSLKEKALKKLSEEKRINLESEIDQINKNIRTAFSTFWDINDSVIFVSDHEISSMKKDGNSGVFFEIIKRGEYTNEKGHVITVTAMNLSSPSNPDLFKNIVPQPGPDSSLVSIVTNLRQLKLNVIYGDGMNKRDLGEKVILINRDEQTNKFGESYVKLIRTKYKESIIEVDYNFLIEALMKKDSRYIYINKGSTYNMEDGTMIPLS